MSPSSAAAPQPSLQDERRAQILEAARACFTRSGFHGASMGQICAEAKMSPGALYRYFPSKDSIIEAIAEDERERAKATMEAFEGPGSFVDRIVRVAMAYLRSSRTNLCGALMVEVCSETLRNSSIAERFHSIEHDIHATFGAAIRHAQTIGEVDPTLDVDRTLLALMAVGDGMMLRLQLAPEAEVESIEPYLRRLVEGLMLPRSDAPPS